MDRDDISGFRYLRQEQLGHRIIVWIHQNEVSDMLHIKDLPSRGDKCHFVYYRQKTIPDPEVIGEYDSIIFLAVTHKQFKDTMLKAAVSKKIKHIEGCIFAQEMEEEHHQDAMEKMNGGKIKYFNPEVEYYKTLKFSGCAIAFMMEVKKKYWLKRKTEAWRDQFNKAQKKKKDEIIARHQVAMERRKRKLEVDRQIEEAKRQRMVELEEDQRRLDALVEEELDEIEKDDDMDGSIDSEVEDQLKELEEETRRLEAEDYQAELNDFGKDDEGVLDNSQEIPIDGKVLEAAGSDTTVVSQIPAAMATGSDANGCENVTIDDIFSSQDKSVKTMLENGFKPASAFLNNDETFSKVIGGLSLAEPGAVLSPFDSKAANEALVRNNKPKETNHTSHMPMAASSPIHPSMQATVRDTANPKANSDTMESSVTTPAMGTNTVQGQGLNVDGKYIPYRGQFANSSNTIPSRMLQSGYTIPKKITEESDHKQLPVGQSGGSSGSGNTKKKPPRSTKAGGKERR